MSDSRSLSRLLSMGFLRQEYWSGLPFPSPGDLPNPEMELISPALAGRFFTTEPPRKPLTLGLGPGNRPKCSDSWGLRALCPGLSGHL